MGLGERGCVISRHAWGVPGGAAHHQAFERAADPAALPCDIDCRSEDSRGGGYAAVRGGNPPTSVTRRVAGLPTRCEALRFMRGTFPGVPSHLYASILQTPLAGALACSTGHRCWNDRRELVRLYLSSFRNGSRPEELLALLNGHHRTGVIVNAADLKPAEERAVTVDEELRRLEDIGLEPTEIDLRAWFQGEPGLRERLGSFSLIWVRGGNTFVLRRPFS